MVTFYSLGHLVCLWQKNEKHICLESFKVSFNVHTFILKFVSLITRLCLFCISGTCGNFKNNATSHIVLANWTECWGVSALMLQTSNSTVVLLVL